MPNDGLSFFFEGFFLSIRIYLLALILFSSGLALPITWVQWNWLEKQDLLKKNETQAALFLGEVNRLKSELDMLMTVGDLAFGNQITYLFGHFEEQCNRLLSEIQVLESKYKKDVLFSFFKQALIQVQKETKNDLLQTLSVQQFDQSMSHVLKAFKSLYQSTKSYHRDSLNTINDQLKQTQQNMYILWSMYLIFTLGIWFYFWRLFAHPLV